MRVRYVHRDHKPDEVSLVGQFAHALLSLDTVEPRVGLKVHCNNRLNFLAPSTSIYFVIAGFASWGV